VSLGASLTDKDKPRNDGSTMRISRGGKQVFGISSGNDVSLCDTRKPSNDIWEWDRMREKQDDRLDLWGEEVSERRNLDANDEFEKFKHRVALLDVIGMAKNPNNIPVWKWNAKATPGNHESGTKRGNDLSSGIGGDNVEFGTESGTKVTRWQAKAH
jgi:hypothetical protein